MFVHRLTEPQKRAFFGLASEMIAADLEIADREMNYLRRLLDESGLDGELDEIGGDVDIDRSIFDDREARLAVTVEILIIAAIDGDLHRDEASFANALIYDFGINETERRKLVQVAGNISSAMTGVEQLIGGEI